MRKSESERYVDRQHDKVILKFPIICRNTTYSQNMDGCLEVVRDEDGLFLTGCHDDDTEYAWWEFIRIREEPTVQQLEKLNELPHSEYTKLFVDGPDEEQLKKVCEICGIELT